MQSPKERVLAELGRIERGEGKGQQVLFERTLRCEETAAAHSVLAKAAATRSRSGAFDTGQGQLLAAPPGLLLPVA